MLNRSKRVCLVSSHHLSYNPRLLKEADALHEAGYDVRVVAMNVHPAQGRWDESLMRTRRWRLQRLNARRDGPGRLTWLAASVRQKFFQKAHFLRHSGALNELALSRFLPELSRMAVSEPADLYIAHNLPALPAAFRAARRQKARLGFDAEDFHRGEFHVGAQVNRLAVEVTKSIEENYIPRCDYVTAASGGIAAAYAEAVHIPLPTTILNVFPLSHRNAGTPKEELANEKCAPGLSLYWYSQVIGSDRGLDDILQALALLPEGISLHLRGSWSRAYEPAFRAQAKRLGIEHRVFILPPAPPGQLVERAAQHDVGLALEPGDRPNNRLAASNKLFTYFLAGLAVAATDVAGQRGIMEAAPGTGFRFHAGDVERLAGELRSWVDNPGQLQVAKKQSRLVGESRFCWDLEKAKLAEIVRQVFEPS